MQYISFEVCMLSRKCFDLAVFQLSPATLYHILLNLQKYNPSHCDGANWFHSVTHLSIKILKLKCDQALLLCARTGCFNWLQIQDGIYSQDAKRITYTLHKI